MTQHLYKQIMTQLVENLNSSKEPNVNEEKCPHENTKAPRPKNIFKSHNNEECVHDVIE